MQRLQPRPLASRLIEEFPGSLQLGWWSTGRWMQMWRVLSPRVLRLLMSRRRPSPREVREVFEELGVTYIKLGQMIASAPSIFPEDYVSEFENCLDNTPPLPFETIRRVVESELGASLEQLYSHFDVSPLASASIAQVHCATLHSGEQVVVKVQKPDVGKILSTDLNLMFVLMRLAEILTPGLSRDAISGFVSEIYQYMIDECDFIKEADNLETFNRFLSESGNQQVVAPKPYRSLSTLKVLTMQKLEGVSIKDFSELQNYSSDPAEILISALNTWFSSVMSCPFFHADLHSGNLLLLDDGRVGFIDFGMVGRIEPEIWHATFALFDGFNTSDAEKIAQAMIAVGMTKTRVDTFKLKQDIEKLFEELDSVDQTLSGSSTQSTLDIDGGISRLLTDVGRLARQHGLHFPYAFTLLFKQLLYFDRYIHNLAPDLDLFGEQGINIPF